MIAAPCALIVCSAVESRAPSVVNCALVARLLIVAACASSVVCTTLMELMSPCRSFPCTDPYRSIFRLNASTVTLKFEMVWPTEV